MFGMPGKISNFALSRMPQMAFMRLFDKYFLSDYLSKFICWIGVMRAQKFSRNEGNSTTAWVFFWGNLSRLPNLRRASLPPHTNAPYNVIKTWENLDSNKRIKQIVKALVDPLSPTRSIVLTGRETFSVRFLWILRNM